tara:strand:+ start:843 stop:995 length:153 start_codon:yes stop_codon:yes gene_type:complete
MDIALHIFLILISFAIAFLGVIILFTFDTQIGFLLALGGITLSLRVMSRT